MKKMVSFFLFFVMAVSQLTALAGSDVPRNGQMLKNTILHKWDFSASQQVTQDNVQADIPVLSGGAEYCEETENIRFNTADGAGIALRLSDKITAQTEENVIRLEFDVNFGKIDKQYFSYSIADSNSEALIECRFMAYNKSTASGFLRVDGADIINDETGEDGSVTATVNSQLVSCISSVTSDGMAAEPTHIENKINLAQGSVEVTISSGTKTGTFTGSFDCEKFTDIAQFRADMTQISTSRYTYLDNLKISQMQYHEAPAPEELVYKITARANGDITTVDTSRMVYGEHVKSFLVTVAREGRLVKQYETDIADNVTVPTADVDDIEICPVYTYENIENIPFNGRESVLLEEPSVLGNFADGRYNISFQKTDGTLTDIYVNGNMVVNNAEQTGKGRGTPKGKSLRRKGC